MTTQGQGAIGSEVDLEITNVAHGGVFVARHQGRVIFVGDTLPGEHVRARLTDDRHSSFWRAETVEVLQPSPHRRPHVWESASLDRDPRERAGGAEFGHIDLAFQRELKHAVLDDGLRRFGRLDGDDVPTFTVDEAVGGETPDGTGWRTRVRLQVDESGTLGPFAARSHHVVAVPDLPLATAEVNSAAPLKQQFESADAVDVVAPSSGETLVLVAEASEQSRRKPDLRPIREVVGDREFTVDARGFWQVHRQAPATLTAAVQSLVDESLFDPKAANLDLYGGVGLLAAALGDRFGRGVRMTTVESSALATDHAAANLSDWIGAAAVTDRVERYVRRLASDATVSERARLHAATVILDPPRSGAGKDVVRSLGELSPAQIVYIACDPIALSRDVALLASQGYRLAELRAWDLFPNTHHLEAAARFVR